MSPLTYEVISDVSAKYGVSIELIVGRCRAYSLALVRAEIAQRLHERGYRNSQIGRVLRRDPATVLYYLGGNKRRRPPGQRWHRPRVRHVCWLKVEQPPKVMKEMRRRFLIPYAGADMTEYVWRPRAHA